MSQDPVIVAPDGQPYLIPIVFGAWSGDGHGDTSREYVWSEGDVARWNAAISMGEEEIGVSLRNICGLFEERSLYFEEFKLLREAGWGWEFKDYRDRVIPDDDDDSREMDTGAFRDLFFFVVSKGDPLLQWTPILNGRHHMEVHPGGYGLYGR